MRQNVYVNKLHIYAAPLNLFITQNSIYYFIFTTLCEEIGVLTASVKYEPKFKF